VDALNLVAGNETLVVIIEGRRGRRNGGWSLVFKQSTSGDGIATQFEPSYSPMVQQRLALEARSAEVATRSRVKPLGRLVQGFGGIDAVVGYFVWGNRKGFSP
jgi:hypothetical protein